MNSGTFIISMITDSCNDILGHQGKNLNSKKAVLGNVFFAFITIIMNYAWGGRESVKKKKDTHDDAPRD